MFGIIQANLSDLTEEEKERYRAFYCGLCHALGERYGFRSRLGLTYDLTFLAMFLSSLYEPEETSKAARCAVHPCRKHNYLSGKYIDYGILRAGGRMKNKLQTDSSFAGSVFVLFQFRFLCYHDLRESAEPVSN